MIAMIVGAGIALLALAYVLQPLYAGMKQSASGGVCAKCGSPTEKDGSFCSNCGAPVSAPSQKTGSGNRL